MSFCGGRQREQNFYITVASVTKYGKPVATDESSDFD
jgi:hypothetical protein